MKKHVLVVDDDVAVGQAMKRVLETAGYEVGLAQDGDEATVHFLPGQTDLLLLDLNLPSQSGWDVFERLTTRYPLVPVIIITGMPNQHSTAVAAGVSAIMEKPIEATALLKTVTEVLAERNEARLRRMCGYQQDTKHLRPPNADAAGKAPPVQSHERRRPPGVRRWNVA
jgi:two-component system, cell cycle response regulator CpdR